MKSGISLALLLTVCISSAYSQQNWKAWAAAAVNFSLTKKVDLRVNHLRSYDLDGSNTNGFNQTSVSLDFKAGKKLSAGGGYMHTGLPSTGSGTDRYFARLGYKIPLFKILNWQNTLQGEYHSANESRFRERVVFNTRISNRKKIEPLGLTLSASFWLYYNIGGSTLRYFDKTGNVLTRNQPDGLHRYRLYLNIAKRITPDFSVTLYYMHQQEMNWFADEFHRINVVNPVTGKISRPFSNYDVAGLSLSYDFDLYKKTTKSKKS